MAFVERVEIFQSLYFKLKKGLTVKSDARDLNELIYQSQKGHLIKQRRVHIP